MSRMMLVVLVGCMATVYQSLARPARLSVPLIQRVEKAAGRRSGIELSLRPPRRRYLVGDRVELEVLIRNRSHKVAQVPGFDLGGSYTVAVVGPDGKSPPLTLLGKRLQSAVRVSYEIEDLLPGKNLGFHVTLNKYYDMSLAGKYSVRISMPLYKDGEPGGKAGSESELAEIQLDEGRP